ncbi:MAG: hypothetical protein COA60_010035 [Robiginitomaculum sp.]|nr:hypothetical protein [Robiginitomaculum sp.]MBL1431817.1 hypothetical protein [Robiginitomaculum sp.]
MNDLIDLAVSELVAFLKANMPELSINWWRLLVFPNLSHQQQRLELSDLSQLDFSTLLRVLDQNWIGLANKQLLPLREGRNWIKELQTVRNNWAHRSVTPVKPNDLYRDLDTLERVLKLLKASNETMQKIAIAKEATVQQMIKASDSLDAAKASKNKQQINVHQRYEETSFPQADRIRQFVLEQYILPARTSNITEVMVRAGDVHAQMKLSHRMPAVCSAVGGKKFLNLAGVKLIRRTGPANGANVYFRFAL